MLNRWSKLDDSHDDARLALSSARKAAEQLLFTPEEGTPALFGYICTIYEIQAKPGETVSLFKKLNDVNEELARSCWIFAKKVVMSAGEPKLAAKYLGNIDSEVRLLLGEHPQIQTGIPLGFKAVMRLPPGSRKTSLENIIANYVRQLIEIAFASGNEEEAYELQTFALSEFDHPVIRKDLSHHSSSIIPFPGSGYKKG